MSVINQRVYEFGTKPSVIRDLFEFGKKRKKEVGEDNVYDFSIGNPSVPSPACVNDTIKKLLDTKSSLEVHGYTSNAGDNVCRKNIADFLNKKYGTKFHYENIFITCGCAPALTATFLSLTTNQDEDEFIAIAPYFPEYHAYSIAKIVVVEPDLENFQINFEGLEKKINKNTRGVIVNSPNNPSGVVYSKENIIKLAEILKKKSEEFKRPIFIISDEPYREISYDDIEVPYITKYYDNTIVCYSFSKSLSLPGERIGFILVPDECYHSKELFFAISGASRAIGHVCAPSLLQKTIAEIVGNTGDINEYKKNRDLLYGSLTELGYKCVKPQGAFYLLVKALEDDDLKFSNKAKEFNILLVPTEGFGCPGYVRAAYCVDYDMIKRSIPAFKAMKEYYDKQK